MNPGLGMKEGLRALRWTIGSCSDSKPVFNAVLVPKLAQSSILQACLQHEYMQTLACIPSSAALLIVPSLFRLYFTLENGQIPACSVKIVIVAQLG